MEARREQYQCEETSRQEVKQARQETQEALVRYECAAAEGIQCYRRGQEAVSTALRLNRQMVQQEDQCAHVAEQAERVCAASREKRHDPPTWSSILGAQSNARRPRTVPSGPADLGLLVASQGAAKLRRQKGTGARIDARLVTLATHLNSSGNYLRLGAISYGAAKSQRDHAEEDVERESDED